jgi:hypothetical protein
VNLVSLAEYGTASVSKLSLHACPFCIMSNCDWLEKQYIKTRRMSMVFSCIIPQAQQANQACIFS